MYVNVETSEKKTAAWEEFVLYEAGLEFPSDLVTSKMGRGDVSVCGLS